MVGAKLLELKAKLHGLIVEKQYIEYEVVDA